MAKLYEKKFVTVELNKENYFVKPRDLKDGCFLKAYKFKDEFANGGKCIVIKKKSLLENITTQFFKNQESGKKVEEDYPYIMGDINDPFGLSEDLSFYRNLARRSNIFSE